MRKMTVAIALCSLSSIALAQGSGKKSVGMSSQSSRGPAQSFQISLPIINLNGELSGHLEKNLNGHAALSLELSSKKSFEEIPEDRQLITGESRMSSGRGASIMISRYGDGNRMAGFYWGIGIGTREENVSWKVKPDTKDPAYKSLAADQGTFIGHEATLRGGTGHGRLGYRYVGESAPFVIGAYLGLRHFEATVTDQKDKDTATRGSDEPPLTAMSAREKDKLKRIYATRPETGVEVGYSF
jgi:hypothetical protein